MAEEVDEVNVESSGESSDEADDDENEDVEDEEEEEESAESEEEEDGSGELIIFFFFGSRFSKGKLKNSLIKITGLGRWVTGIWMPLAGVVN